MAQGIIPPPLTGHLICLSLRFAVIVFCTLLDSSILNINRYYVSEQQYRHKLKSYIPF